VVVTNQLTGDRFVDTVQMRVVE